MPRKAAPVILDQPTRNLLNNIANDNCTDKWKVIRAMVVLKLADKVQVKTTAETLNVSEDTVRTYRDTFNARGIDALMHREPNLGRCGNEGILVSKKLQQHIQGTTSDKKSDRNVKQIAETLGVSASAVYKEFQKLDGKESNIECIPLPVSLKQGNNQVRGVYISSSTQILAVSHAEKDPTVASENECLMVYDSSDVEYRESAIGKNYERELSLATQSIISVPNRGQGKMQSPADFIQTIMNTPYVDGEKTIFLVNSRESNEVSDYISDPSVLYTHVSFDDIKVTWHTVIDLGNYASTMFLNEISEFLNRSTDDSHPFIWRAARILKDQSVPFYLNNTCIKRTLFSTVGREDESGNTISCTSCWYDDVPSSTTFAKSGDIVEYLSNVETLEESLMKNAQSALNCMAEHTMCNFIDLDALSNSKSNTEKQRLVEVESRIGRQSAVLNSQIDTSSLSSNERLWSPTLKKEVILLAHHSSFEVTADELNLSHMRDDCIKFSPRTIDDCCQRWGNNVHQEQLQQTHDILVESGFDPESAKPLSGTSLPSCPNESEIQEMEAKIQEMLNDFHQNHPNFPNMVGALESVELPENSVILLIDDVSVNRQKEHRDINGKVGSKSAETVGNTTAVIICDGMRYVITADDTREALKISLAYMLKNKLLENRILVTFSDGASEIRKAIPEIFGFHKALKQYLDWYHVCKRITENLSMGLKCGKENRDKKQEIIKEILEKLWFGDIDAAIKKLGAIDATFIRNAKKVQDTIAYLEARRQYLYCYVARKIAGVTNSSARVEGLNDSLVASRQKHKRMSWSESGSHGLASLAMLIENGDLAEWIINGTVRFRQMRRPEISVAC